MITKQKEQSSTLSAIAVSKLLVKNKLNKSTKMSVNVRRSLSYDLLMFKDIRGMYQRE